MTVARLVSGTELPAYIVFLSIEVRPDSKLAKAADPSGINLFI